MKKCRGCQKEKPESEFGHYGRKHKCKQCCLDYFAKYRKSNRGKMRSNQRKYYNANKKEICQRKKEQGKRYREANKEKIREARKDYYEKNKEKINKKTIEWKKNNPDKVKQYRKRYYKKNKDSIDVQEKEYRDRNREKINARQRDYYSKNKDIFRNASRRYAKKNPWVRMRNNIYKRILKQIRGGKENKRTEEIIGYKVKDLVVHIESQFSEGMSWDNYGEWHIDHIKPVSSFNIESVDDPEVKECWAIDNLRPLWAKDNMAKGDSMLEYQQRTGMLF